MRVILKIFIIFLLLFINLYPDDNEIQCTHLTAEDGLSLNIVTKILQDSRGFLWFGTYDGLNRYEGYNFKIFLPEPSNPNSISSHSITALYEDSEGYIWVGTSVGLNRYDWKTEQFKRYRNDSRDSNSISNNHILSIKEDKSGRLWIGTIDGLNRFNKKKDNFSVFKRISDEDNPNKLNSVTAIEEDSKGNIWLGTWKGLSCIQPDSKIFYKLFPDQDKYPFLRYNNISGIIEDGSGNLWISTFVMGIYKYNISTGNFTQYTSTKDPLTLSDNIVRSIFIDKENNLWAGTSNGLNKFNIKENRFTRMFHDPRKTYSIPDNEIYSITQDKTGLIWIGSAGGVSWFYQSRSEFHSFKNIITAEKALNNSKVHSLCVDKQENIWAGAKNGLFKIESGTNKITHFINNPKEKNSLTNNYVWAVAADHLGSIWIGTNSGGLNCYNPKTGIFDVYKYNSNDQESISNNGVISVCEDFKGDIWAGTWWGLNLFDRINRKFKRYTGFKQNTIWVVFEDSKHLLWLGTDGGGANLFNPKTGEIINFSNDSTQSNVICGNRVISIFESNDGTMWLGTTEGLSSFDRNKNKFTDYSRKNGLPSNAINGIHEDKKGCLWISTDKGISKFDRKNNVFINFSKRNGLKEIEFSANASAETQKGNIFFGCKKGIIFFNPDSIRNNFFDAPTVFTDLKIYNQSVLISKNSILQRSITCSNMIKISSASDVITIEFALLDYFNPKTNKFYYKLSGFDPLWNNVGSRNSATYTNLPPGEYKFLLKASNNNITENSREASLVIIIEPSFLQTIWFKLIAALTAVVFTFIIVQNRTYRIKKRNAVLEKRIAERTQDLDRTIQELSQEISERKKAESKVQASLEEKEILLKEIHHRVKNNLQIISSLLYLNSKKLNDGKMLDTFRVSQNRIKSIALIHERLYQSKDLAKINFKEYVQRLANDLFSSYALNQGVITLELDIEDILISVDSAVPFGLIINELISNSLKYAFTNYEEEKKSGLIKINFRKNKKEEYILEVSDNGAGIPDDFEERKKNSLGLQLIETLVAQLEAVLEIKYSPGTLFRIKFKNDKGIL